MGPQIGVDCKHLRVKAAVAAGTTDVNSTGVDMAGFDEVVFETLIGTITSGAVTSAKLEQSDDDGSSDAYSAIDGCSVTIADTMSDKAVVLGVRKPRKRYVRCTVDRGTQNCVVDGIMARLYGGRVLPPTDDSTIIGRAFANSPAES